MTDSSLLGLPYMDAAQSQKHVTHNEALALIDVAMYMALDDANALTPPPAAYEGQRVLVGAAPTGAFASHAGQIAAMQDGAWRFLSPRKGWLAYVAGAGDTLIYNGVDWISIAATVHDLQDLSRLGVGATADSANPLLVKVNNALFTARAVAEGGNNHLRLVLNKSATGATVSQLYQSAYSGRAETGLIGDDRFRIKVSANGAAWTDAMTIDPATGVASFPAGVVGPGAGLSFRRLETFNASGVFTRQAGDVSYFVVATGGGGGGGSGRRSAAGTASGGGAGGNGGHVVEDWIVAASTGATTTITVGAGGNGGAAAADSANGAAGSTGGATTAFTLYARGGAGGGGGSATAGGAAPSTSADAFTSARFRPGPGGAGSAAATGSNSASSGGPSGGGGGAGLSIADVESPGGAAAISDATHALMSGIGAAAGTVASPNGATAAAPASGRFGAGGGGGASKAAVAAGNGGAGAQAGGGGGGGGGGRNGQTGGAGGSGGPGRVLIYVYG